MTKHLSVIKRIAIAERNRCRNKIYKSTIKTLTKKYLTAVNDQQDLSISMKDLQPILNQVYSKIDKSVKRGILHKNNGACKKVFLARALEIALV